MPVPTGGSLATTYYFLEAPDQPSAVLDWFRSQDPAPAEYPQDQGILLHFAGAGPLGEDDTGEIEVSQSPLVSVFLPKVRRKALWTVGEVHFLAKKVPELELTRRRFEQWLRSHPKVFDQAHPDEGYPYYLEGGIQNIARRIFALPSGLRALQVEQYFVAEGTKEYGLDLVCQSLRLRGVLCE